jgi:hypothetical protein
VDRDGEGAAEVFQRFLHARLDRSLVPHVHAVHLRAAARGGSYLLARPNCRGFITAIEEGEVRARLGQALCDGAPDVACAARDERRLAGKVNGPHILERLARRPMALWRCGPVLLLGRGAERGGEARGLSKVPETSLVLCR